MATRVWKPPPIISNCRVTHYAIRDGGIPFVGRTHLFVDDKELGAVPCMAIAEGRRHRGVLFYCTRNWNCKGVVPYDTTQEAKRAAERNYPGLSLKWRRTGYSVRVADRYRRIIWKGTECSFCRRLPVESDRMIHKRHVRICNICVSELAKLLPFRSKNDPPAAI
jgi:hypothetical protein